MDEITEHKQAMREPEGFTLELPPGHPGHRPISALIYAIKEMRIKEDRITPLLERIRQGEQLNVDQLSELTAQLDSLSASIEHACRFLAPLHLHLIRVLDPDAE